MHRLRVLFLCTGNSCRSQMAEAWARRLKADAIEPFSAGVAPTRVDPRAVAAMAEVGVDIAGSRSKDVRELKGESFDFVVTVCDHARESCPVLPGGAPVVHAGFEDPPALARSAASEEEAMGHYRRVRDRIRDYVKTLPEALVAG